MKQNFISKMTTNMKQRECIYQRKWTLYEAITYTHTYKYFGFTFICIIDSLSLKFVCHHESN